MDVLLGVMKSSPLYDYGELRKDEFKEDFIHTLNLLKANNPSKFRFFTLNEKEIDELRILASKTWYHDELTAWVANITALEKKGYPRDEIVGILTQAPVHGWNAIARRIPENKAF